MNKIVIPSNKPKQTLSFKLKVNNLQFKYKVKPKYNFATNGNNIKRQ